MFRQIIAFIILLALLFGMGGYLALFKMEQLAVRRSVKEQMEHSIPREQLYQISFAADEKINWSRENKEFSYKGSMYDVIYKEHHGSVTHYYCIKDKEETRLLAGLTKLIKHQIGTRHGKAGKTLLKLLFSLNYYLPTQITLSFNFEDIPVEIEYYSEQYMSFVKDIHPPPPKLA